MKSLFKRFLKHIHSYAPKSILTVENDPQKYYRHIFFSYLVFAGGIINVLALVLQFNAPLADLISVAGVSVLLLFDYFCLRFKNISLGISVTAFGICLLQVHPILSENIYTSKSFHWFYVVPILLAPFGNRKQVLIFSILSYALYLGLQIYLKDNGLPMNLPSTMSGVDYWLFNVIEYTLVYTSITVAILIFMYILDTSRKITVDQYEHSLNESKLMTAGYLSSGISHEINNPLQIIHSASRQLKKLDTYQNEKSQNVLLKIEKAVRRIANIVKYMESFHSFKNLNLKQHTLTDIIDSTLQDISIPANVKINVDVKDDHIICDRNSMVHICQNLATNALRALQNIESPSLTIVSYKVADEIFLDFIDNGEGVDQDKEHFLFDPISATKTMEDGKGLGLSLARSLLKNLNGDLQYIRSKNKTTFRISLPNEAQQLAA
jgi:signal transduction histidine kinase